MGVTAIPPPTPSAIKSIQRGIAGIEQGPLTVSAVDPSKSILTVEHSNTGGTNSPSGYIQNATTIYVYGSGVPVAWQLLEYN